MTVLPDSFTLTRDHLHLLAALRLHWDDSGDGAPTVNPENPYGGTVELPQAVASILGHTAGADMEDDPSGRDGEVQDDRLVGLHQDLLPAMSIVLSGHTEPGVYNRSSHWSSAWFLVQPAALGETPKPLEPFADPLADLPETKAKLVAFELARTLAAKAQDGTDPGAMADLFAVLIGPDAPGSGS